MPSPLKQAFQRRRRAALVELVGLAGRPLRRARADDPYHAVFADFVAAANALGDYRFNGLRFGPYRAAIDTSTAPSGSDLTTPDHVDVDLAPGEVSDQGDFGLAPSLLPFTGASILWLLRIGLCLVAIGPWLARRSRRRSQTVLERGWEG